MWTSQTQVIGSICLSLGVLVGCQQYNDKDIQSGDKVLEVQNKPETIIPSKQSAMDIELEPVQTAFPTNTPDNANLDECGAKSGPIFQADGYIKHLKSTGSSCPDLSEQVEPFDLDDIEDGIADLGVAPLNLQAQQIHRVVEIKQPIESGGYDLSGKGIKVGVWDGGAALRQHVEFGGRVRLGDFRTINGKKTQIINSHATHVAGTVAAGGRIPEAQGMAHATEVHTYNWDNDLSELKASPVSVSNHSYGVVAGWSLGSPTPECNSHWFWYGRDTETEDWTFGRYSYTAEAYDSLIFTDRKDLSVFRAAGNEGQADADPVAYSNRLPAGHPRKFDGSHCVQILKDDGAGNLIAEWTLSQKQRKTDFHNSGYDTIASGALAKNIITIGALVDLNPAYKPSDCLLYTSPSPRDS